MGTTDTEEALMLPETFRQPAKLTAVDLPVDDSDIHQIGRCTLITMQHFDCGLVW